MEQEVSVCKEFRFEAAHYLPGHEKCSNIHGHSYILEVEVASPKDMSSFDMVVDFAELKDIVNEQIVKKLDHSLLNANEVFDNKVKNSPTAENLVMWMWNVLATELDGDDRFLYLKRIRLYETATSFAEIE